jgi:GNAT superfamily N-acetyltransferase
MSCEIDIPKEFLGITSSGRIIPLRHEILRPGRGVEAAQFDGDKEPTTFHFAATLTGISGEPICCVSYMKVDYEGKPAYQLRGMATAKTHQGKGIGKRLVEFAEKVITSNTGIKLFWCNARSEAVGFYEKIGWEKVGEEFSIPDVGPHFIMIKEIKD